MKTFLVKLAVSVLTITAVSRLTLAEDKPLSKPAERLTPELADGLVDVFLCGVGTGRSIRANLPPFAGGEKAGKQ